LKNTVKIKKDNFSNDKSTFSKRAASTKNVLRKT
jgi:hypothetical protein